MGQGSRMEDKDFYGYSDGNVKQDETFDEIEGYVASIIYRNAENGYTVLELEMGDGNQITCVGSFPGISEGVNLLVRGNYIEHQNYGMQLKVTSFEETIPKDTEAMKRYIGSGAIKGIGPALAARIVRKFGDKTFDVMENEPERLAEIKGISETKAMEIADQMVEKRDMRSAMMYLGTYGIQGQLALKLYNRYGARIRTVLETNPYQVAEDVQGVGFRTADEIARKLGVSADSEYRVRCGILYVLSTAAGRGHTYLPKDQLLTGLEELLNSDITGFETQIENLLVDRKIRVVDGEEVYAANYFRLERESADLLLHLNEIYDASDEGLLDKIREIEESLGMELDDMQRDAVRDAATHGVFVLTGGPGTGKTTTIRTMIEYFLSRGEDVLLGAPTGRAAKRMSEATGYEARTIHRMLEVHGMQDDTNARGDERENLGMFERNSSNPLEADAVIIDEMSMVDITLFHSLLLAIPEGCRLILVGDINQLPSVGPGNVLHDIINSKAFSEVCLTKIFRQAASSDIVVNAHKINHGEEVKLDNKSEDFFFMERNDADHIIKIMLDLVQTNLPKYVNASPYDIQILTPTRKGRLGVESLNAIFQRYLNPKSDRKTEYVSGDRIFREGDKVMQIKNNYQLEWTVQGSKGITTESGTGVFNGDTGIVKKINLYDSKLTVEYEENRLVDYDLKELSDLELAYAVTVHKSQGSEYPAVVIPMMQVPRMLMNRNILYTAVTRAKKCVVMVGEEEVFRKMVANGSQLRRYSGLEERIQEEIEKRTGLS